MAGKAGAAIGQLAPRQLPAFSMGADDVLPQQSCFRSAVVIAACAVLVSGVVTTVIGFALKYTMGWRISAEDEVRGIDLAEHGETAYDNPTTSARLA